MKAGAFSKEATALFQLNLGLVALVLLSGCVSNPVTEFRGTTVNLNGAGQVEAGIHELGEQTAGIAPGGEAFLGLGFGNGATFLVLYPKEKALGKTRPSEVKAILIRDPDGTTTQHSGRAFRPPDRIVLEGSIEIWFRDNTRFRIRVNLKDNATNAVSIRGEFVAYHHREFAPGAYASAAAMAFGVSEGALGPARSPAKEGGLGLVHQAVRNLAAREEGAFDVSIVGVSRCITFSKRTYFKRRYGVHLTVPVESRESALRSRMTAACEALNLKATEAPTVNLANPELRTEPLCLSVDLYGNTASDTADVAIVLLRQVFGVADDTRFTVAE